MMATVNLTCVSAFVIFLLIGCSESEVQDIVKFNEVTNKFAWNLYKEVNHQGNTVVSPIALQLLLDILLQGANGSTADEIARVLQHEVDDKSILDAYKQFLELQYQNTNKTSSFKLAAAIAVDQSFPLSEVSQIDKRLSEHFKTDMLRYNFKDNAEESIGQINGWVHNHTDGEIKKLLPEGSIDSSTEMVMVSGTVFKGVWKKKFDKKNTREESFHIKPNVAVNVKMMALTGGRFRYAWNSKFGTQIVELPYTEEEFRMIIMLPIIDGLAELESKLTYENLFESINSVRETDVDVFLPRFKIKRSIKLVNILKEMGMLTAFTRNADFSKMTNSSISVSNVLQKTMIMVNEKGTRAAAGSGLVISAKRLPPQMVCNTPFLYLILKGNTILFIGSFLKP